MNSHLLRLQHSEARREGRSALGRDDPFYNRFHRDHRVSDLPQVRWRCVLGPFPSDVLMIVGRP